MATHLNTKDQLWRLVSVVVLMGVLFSLVRVEDLRLSWMRPFMGYGPDLYRYPYFLESFPKGGSLLVYEAQHTHNFYMPQLVEQGLLGLGASLGIFAVVILGGSYLLL